MDRLDYIDLIVYEAHLTKKIIISFDKVSEEEYIILINGKDSTYRIGKDNSTYQLYFANLYYNDIMKDYTIMWGIEQFDLKAQIEGHMKGVIKHRFDVCKRFWSSIK